MGTLTINTYSGFTYAAFGSSQSFGASSEYISSAAFGYGCPATGWQGPNPLTLTGSNYVITIYPATGSASIVYATTLSLATSVTPSGYGSPAIFAATISSGPTGSVTFYDGGAAIGTGTISGNTATLTTTTLALGVHSITASWAGSGIYSAATSNAVTQTVNQGTQLIIFPPPVIPPLTPVPYGTAPIALSVSSTSGLPVSLAVTGPATLSSGNALTITGTGTVTITASQAGNADYLAATPRSWSITVTPATPTVTVTSTAGAYGTPINLTATSTYLNNGVATPTSQAVTYTLVSGSATLSGGVLTPTALGSVVVQASVAATGNFNAATSANTTITVGKASLTVTANNANRTYGAANPAFTPAYSGFVNGDTASVLTGAPSLTTTATATSSAGTYAITPAAGTLSATNYAFVFVNGTLTVGKATPTITASVVSSPVPYGSIATVNVQVSCNSACGSVDYKINGSDWGTVALNSSGFFSAIRAAGEDAPGTYSVTITYLGNGNYNSATSNTVTFTVNKATPAVAWPTPAGIAYGTTLSATQLNATASGVSGTNLTGSFSYTPGFGSLPPAGSNNLSVIFTPTDTTDYNPATASVSLVVNPIITALSTLTPAEGAILTIAGSGFGQSQAASAVTVSSISAPVQTWTSSRIAVTIPVGAASGTGMVAVIVNGASSNAASLKLPVTLTVSLNPPMTSYGTSVAATAEVTSGTPSTPRGAISCMSGSTSLPPQNIPSGGNGAATLQFIFNNLPVGNDTITCVFTHAAGTFWKDTTATAIEDVTPPLFPVVVSLNSSGSPTTYGDLVTLSTAVISQQSPLTPTGSITFYVDGNPYATQPLASGAAQITTGALSVETHKIFATYSGDQNFSPGKSITITQITASGSGACIR